MNPGDRIILISMPDDPHPIPPGTKGTIISSNHVCFDPNDSFIQYDIKWDNGRRLSAVCPPDVLQLESKDQS